MSLDQFFERLEAQARSWGERVWGDSPAARLWAEIDRLSDELQHHHREASRLRSAVEEARARLAGNQVREATLASHVETFVHVGDQPKAWQLAIDLDNVRRQMAEDRAQLPEDEASRDFHERKAAELQKQLAQLQAKLYSPRQCAG
jgi:hypothetical protein